MESNRAPGNLIQLIRHRSTVFITTLLISVVAAAAYLYLTPSQYRSEAVIKKPAEKERLTQISLMGNDRSAATEQLQSISYLTKVFESNQELLTSYYITTDYRTEQTTYRFPFDVRFRITGNTAFAQQQYTIETVNDQIYKLTTSTETKQGTFGKELADRNIVIIVTPKNNGIPASRFFVSPPRYTFTIESPSAIANRLIDEKRIETSDRNGIVTIACTAAHPDFAQRLTRTIAQHYIAGTVAQPSAETIPSYIQHLDEKIELVATQMGATEQKIAEYKRDHRITDLNLDTETSLSVYRELQLQKTNLEVKMAALDNLSNYLRKFRDENNSLVEYGTIDDTEFTADLNKLNALYQNNEQAAKHKEVEQLKSGIAERILNTRKKTAIQIEGLTLALQNNQRSLAAIPGKATALQSLDRQLELDKKVYDLLTQKRAQAMVDFQVAPEGGQIIKDAGMPTAPNAPVAWLVALIALLTALVAGWPVAYSLELRQISKISSRQSIQELVPMLGSISAQNAALSSTLASFNGLCTRILMMRDLKTITVTSAGSNCGKTTTVTGLAKTFAAMGRKVLVMDMNIKNQQAATVLKTTTEHTLAELLDGTATLEQAITNTEYPNLDVLSAGKMPMGINSWLSDRRREHINQQLQSQYDYILIDTPETIGRVDALPFIRTSSLTLFVMRQGASKQESLGMIKELSGTLQTNTIYGVINNYTKETHNQSTTTETDEGDNKTGLRSLLRRVALWSY